MKQDDKRNAMPTAENLGDTALHEVVGGADSVTESAYSVGDYIYFLALRPASSSKTGNGKRTLGRIIRVLEDEYYVGSEGTLYIVKPEEILCKTVANTVSRPFQNGSVPQKDEADNWQKPYGSS